MKEITFIAVFFATLVIFAFIGRMIIKKKSYIMKDDAPITDTDETERPTGNDDKEILENDKLMKEDIAFLSKRLYTKLTSLFSEVTDGNAELATYYVVDYCHTRKLCYLTVQKLPTERIFINVFENKEIMREYAIDDDYSSQYIYFQLDRMLQTAHVMCVKSSTDFHERTAESVYHQNYLNDIADLFLTKFVNDETYLQEYITKDNMKFYGKNQPKLSPEEQTKIYDNEPELVHKDQIDSHECKESDEDLFDEELIDAEMLDQGVLDDFGMTDKK